MKQFIFTYDTKNTDSKQLLELIIEFLVKRNAKRITKPLGSTIIFYCSSELTQTYWNTAIIDELDSHLYYVLAEIHFFPPSFNLNVTVKYENSVRYDENTETFAELVERISRKVQPNN